MKKKQTKVSSSKRVAKKKPVERKWGIEWRVQKHFVLGGDPQWTPWTLLHTKFSTELIRDKALKQLQKNDTKWFLFRKASLTTKK